LLIRDVTVDYFYVSELYQQDFGSSDEF